MKSKTMSELHETKECGDSCFMCVVEEAGEFVLNFEASGMCECCAFNKGRLKPLNERLVKFNASQK